MEDESYKSKAPYLSIKARTDNFIFAFILAFLFFCLILGVTNRINWLKDYDGVLAATFAIFAAGLAYWSALDARRQNKLEKQSNLLRELISISKRMQFLLNLSSKKFPPGTNDAQYQASAERQFYEYDFYLRTFSEFFDNFKHFSEEKGNNPAFPFHARYTALVARMTDHNQARGEGANFLRKFPMHQEALKAQEYFKKHEEFFLGELAKIESDFHFMQPPDSDDDE